MDEYELAYNHDTRRISINLTSLVDFFLERFLQLYQTKNIRQKVDLNKIPFSKNLLYNPEENTCSICFDEFKEDIDVSKLKCNHLFHFSCIDKWMEQQSTCPICRTEHDIQHIQHIQHYDW